MGRAGRTARRRNKAARNFRRLDHEPELVSLSSWLAQNGTEWNRKLGYANFEHIGRGLIANRALERGELLVDLPLTLTINITTVLLDEEFIRIFADCNQNAQNSLSLQSLLAFYLINLKHKSTHSKWHVYIKSLPTEYTVPYFLRDCAKINLENSIRSIVEKQEDTIKSSFKIFTNILKHTKDTSSTTKLMQKTFSIEDYEWAYFTVNTRCVYMDLTEIVDLGSIKSPLLPLLKDNLTIALCPYLDMINHSSSVQTKTKLVLKLTAATSTPIKAVTEDTLSKIRFHLYTMNRVKSFKEVYICYGDSHNLKLVTEYGFYLPSNRLDSVNFEFETIKKYLSSQNMKLSQEQCSFISSHNLCKGLYIDSSGLSFNFYALLTVLKFYNNDKNNISKVIYSPDELGSGRSSLNDIIKPLVNERILEIEDCIAKVEHVQSDSTNLRICLDLMQRYVVILKSIQK